MVLQYLPHKPVRDYGLFSSGPDENSKPLPTVQWDSQIVFSNKINNLRQVNLLNYELVSQTEDPEDSLVEVQFVFSDISFMVVPITVKRQEALNRPYQSPFVNEQTVEFLIEFDDIEELFAEMRLQFYFAHLSNC